jgi:uncharacterized repeat protein (TIGR01451 family)
MRHTHTLTSPLNTSTLRLIKGWHLLFVAAFVFLASVGFAVLLYSHAAAFAGPSLGTAQSFAVLGGSTVTNTGMTVVTGDLGVSPGSAVTGFPPGVVVGGTIHANDAVAMQAQNDVTTAYNALAGMACNTALTGQDLGGLTLTPGVYCFTSSAQLTGTLTLDAQCDPNAVFIFQIASTLTTASSSSVQIINGGQNCNVFWQVGSSATLGTGTAFVGNILALASITLTTGSSLSGRALARTGAVTMDTNAVSAPSCITAAAPTLGKAFSPATINTGGISTLTITLSNPNSWCTNLTAPLTDTLPMGVVIAAVPNASTTCGGGVTATAGGSTVTLTGGSIPAGAPGTCTVTVNVTAALGGNYLNTLPAGALQTTNGNNAAPASATLTVVPPSGPPLLGKAFNLATINAGGVSTLTITLINPNAGAATLTAPLTDTLPAGVVIAPAPNEANTCGGVVTATAGGSTVTLTGGAIPGGSPGTCTVTVNVTAALGGSYLNIIPANALQTNNGFNAAPASATLTVVPPPPPVPPTLSKAFSPATINAGGFSTLTITLSNPNTTVANLTAPFIDTLPSGVLIAAVPNASTTCPGSGAVAAAAGGSTVTLPVGRSIPAGNGIIAGTCTVTVNVTAAAPGSYVNTLLPNVLQTSNGNNVAPAIAILIVSGIDLSILKTGSALVALETTQFTYTLSVVNFGPGAATGVTVTDTLPAGLTLVSATPSQGACSGTSTITCSLGNLANQATATVTLVVLLPMKSAGSVLSNTATITSNQPEIAPANNTSTLSVPVEKVPPGPGLTLPPASPVSDTKPGSVLIFPYYTSDASNPNRTNTRISITNVENQWSACVHLFFVDGTSCSVADATLCLTPNQTASFLLSDIDPGTSGYLVAVLVDCMTGCPLNINTLIGHEYVKLASGHAANLGAEAIAGLPGVLASCDGNSSTAELRFDGVMYNQLPRVLALDNIASRADGNDTLLIINRIGGSLATGAATLGALFGLLYDDAENPLSFSFPAGTCQFRSSLSNNFPRVAPRFEQFIPAGRFGWAKFYSLSDIGILGAAINFNPNAGTAANAFNQGHNLHKLALTSSASLTIPIFPPNC